MATDEFYIQENLGKAALARVRKIETGAVSVYDPRLIPITDALETRITDNEDDILNLQSDNNAHRLHGVISGMDVSINANPRYFNIAAGTYYINGTKVSYQGGLIDTVSIGAGEFGSVTIDASGIVTLIPNNFPFDELVNELEICAFTKSDPNTIDQIGDSSFNGLDFIRKIHLRNKLFEGTYFSENTGLITENATNDRQLDISGGYINTPNSDIGEITATTNITGSEQYRTGGTYSIYASSTIVLRNNVYDNGNLVALGTDKYVVHTVARSTRTGNIYVAIGTSEYDNVDTAILAPVNYGLLDGMLGSEVEPLANVVIKEGATNISSVVDLRNNRSRVNNSLASIVNNKIDAIATNLGLSFNEDGTII